MFKIEKYNSVSLDSSAFIYFIQEDPIYTPIVEHIFTEIAYGNIMGISSYLTLLEVLVKPIQKGEKEIAIQYRDFMLNNDYLRLLPLDKKVAETAAELRAKYNGNGLKLRTPDAIHIATGIIDGADIFVTNDRKLKQVKEIEVIVLCEEI